MPEQQVQVRKYDVKDLVERLEPDRHDPTPEYEFSNGRKFTRRPGEWYGDVVIP